MKCFISRGADSLKLEERPAPGPLGPGQIRVAMKAASLNYRDVLVLSGALASMTLPELIPRSRHRARRRAARRSVRASGGARE